MSAQRKQMRDDLLSREKEAVNSKKREYPSEPEATRGTKEKTPHSVFKDLISNQDACLLLKCKFPDNIDRKLALEMVKTALNPVSLHEDPAMFSVVAAEFANPQDAYKAFCMIPTDFIVKPTGSRDTRQKALKSNLDHRNSQKNRPQRRSQSSRRN